MRSKNRAVRAPMEIGEEGVRTVKSVLIRALPVDLHSRLFAEASRRGLNLADVIVERIAASYQGQEEKGQSVWACFDPARQMEIGLRNPDAVIRAFAVRSAVAGGETKMLMRGTLWTLDGRPMLNEDFASKDFGRRFVRKEKVWFSPDAGRTLWILRQVWFQRTSTALELGLDLSPQMGAGEVVGSPWQVAPPLGVEAVEQAIIENMQESVARGGKEEKK